MTQIVCTISLLIFVGLMLFIGIRSTKKAQTMDGFLLGGRKTGPWISAFSYGTSYFSAVIFVGYSGMHGWNIGISSIWIGVGNAILGCLLSWLLLAQPTRRMTNSLNARTMPEFFAARYNSKALKAYSAIVIFIFLVPYAASVYKGLGFMFSSIFVGTPATTIMFIVAALTAVYLVLGGYVASSMNDFIQGIIIIVGVIIMIVAITIRPEVGGVFEGVNRLKAIDPSLANIFGGDNVKFLLTNILLTSFGVWGLPQMVHKFYAIKDKKAIKTATIVSTLFCVLIGIGAYYSGIFSRLFIAANGAGLPDLAGGFDAVVPTILTTVLSGNIFMDIILSIIVLLLLSASMSTLSAIVLTSSSAISVDLLKMIKPKIEDKAQVVITRTFCLVFVALSFLFATMNISFIVNLMSFSWGVVAGSFIGPFLWGLYAKWITKAGAWCGSLCGVIIVLGGVIIITMTNDFALAKSLAPELGVIAMGASVVLTPLVSLITKKFSVEHVDKVFEVKA